MKVYEIGSDSSFISCCDVLIYHGTACFHFQMLPTSLRISSTVYSYGCLLSSEPCLNWLSTSERKLLEMSNDVLSSCQWPCWFDAAWWCMLMIHVRGYHFPYLLLINFLTCWYIFVMMWLDQITRESHFEVCFLPILSAVHVENGGLST